MSNPLISVIVPTVRTHLFLAHTLQNIFTQGVERLEVLVVDGSGRQHLESLPEDYPEVRWLMQIGTGLAGARNQGLAAAKGEWIAFLDDDDLWPSGSLTDRASYLAQHPDCLGVGGKIQRFLQPDAPLPPQYSGGRLEQIELGYTPGALLARRALWQQVGPFDPTLAIGCDSDWFARLLDARLPWVLLPQVVLHKRIHQSNLSANASIYRTDVLQLVRRSLQRKVKQAADCANRAVTP